MPPKPVCLCGNTLAGVRGGPVSAFARRQARGTRRARWVVPDGALMTAAYFVLVPLSLCSGSTVLFLLLDRIRRSRFTEDA